MGIGHGDPVAGPGEHRHVVGHIAERDHVSAAHPVLGADASRVDALLMPGAADLEQHVAGIRDGRVGAGELGDDRVNLIGTPLRVLDQQLRDRIAQQLGHVCRRRWSGAGHDGT